MKKENLTLLNQKLKKSSQKLEILKKDDIKIVDLIILHYEYISIINNFIKNPEAYKKEHINYTVHKAEKLINDLEKTLN